MDDLLTAYLPSDRYRTLASGVDLPNRARGTALFADISGFSSVTDALVNTLGVRRGVEELSHLLNRLYDPLVATVDDHGGSIIGFSGDAMICWFDDVDGEPALRAVESAWAMQGVMAELVAVQPSGATPIPLTLKVGIASGPTRRFVVGDSSIQRMDVLAGATLSRLARAEQIASPGEIIIDRETRRALGPALRVTLRDKPPASSDFFRVGTRSSSEKPATVFSRLRAVVLPDKTLRPWLPPSLFERLRWGHGEFVTELRPAVALFVHFEGIDYDGDERAGEKLDTYICRTQHILQRYGGTLIQLTTGDKGDYLYATFGAPLSHEDDARRAVTAALELRALSLEIGEVHSFRCGISRGIMLTGTYGGTTRRTYGVLGVEANIAARLMTQAEPAQVLITDHMLPAVAEYFECLPRPPVVLKGTHVPVAVCAVVAERPRERGALLAEHTSLPFVGRKRELAFVDEKIALALQGNGQIVGIVAEAGAGKSRFIAEIIRRLKWAVMGNTDSRTSTTDSLSIYIGECEATGTHSPYLVWRPIWNQMYGIDQGNTGSEKIQRLRETLSRINPSALPQLPLLGTVLGLPIADGDATRGLTAEVRKSQREQILMDSFRRIARAGNASSRSLVVLILEDAHWMDSVSRDLLHTISRAVSDLPVLLLLAYRPHADAAVWAQWSQFTELALSDLTAENVGDLIEASWVTRSEPGARDSEAWQGVKAQIIRQAEGNPFYVEELLNYFHECHMTPIELAAQRQSGLPDSLHTLILSRTDQLDERMQFTLKVASIIGRQFRVAWLHGYYPDLGATEQVEHDLMELAVLNLLLPDQAEPDEAYLFKHAITQEVTYESLAFATRATLHGRLAAFLERLSGSEGETYLHLLAFHYERSPAVRKAVEVLYRAGESARAAFANQEAIHYYERALARLDAESEDGNDWRPPMVLRLHEAIGDVYSFAGQPVKAREAYRAARAIAPPEPIIHARLVRKTGFTLRLESRYVETLDAYDTADALIGPEPNEPAPTWWQEWLEIQQERLLIYYFVNRLDDLIVLSNRVRPVIEREGTAVQRATYYQHLMLLGCRRDRYRITDETLNYSDAYVEASRDMGDPVTMGKALFFNGVCLQLRDELDTAEMKLLESLSFGEQTGDATVLAWCLTYLTVVYRRQGRLSDTSACAVRSLDVARPVGLIEFVAAAMANQAWLEWRRGQFDEARKLGEQALDTWDKRDKRNLGYPFKWLSYWPLIGVALRQERIVDAIEHVRALLLPPQQRMPDPLETLLLDVINGWDEGRHNYARLGLDAAVELAQVLRFL